MSQARRKQQYLIFFLFGAAVLAAMLLVGTLMNGSQKSLGGGSLAAVNVDETLINDRTSAASPEMTWITTSSQNIERLTLEVKKLGEDLTRARETAEAERQAILDEAAEQAVRQQGQINDLRAQLEAQDVAIKASSLAEAGQGGPVRTASLDAGPPGSFVSRTGGRLNPLGQTVANNRTGPFGVPAADAARAGGADRADGTGVGPVPAAAVAPPQFGVSFGLTPKPDTAPVDAVIARKHLSHYLPAGSYAPAVVISGVDASTGVVSQDNPIPVTMRIAGPATTAGAGTIRGRKVNITGCMVLGSAVGDLSSERVYVRLNKMTCLSGADVLEADVAGYVSGAGKAGVRGQVVSREGNLTRNAAIAGALQGLASGLSGAGETVAGADHAGIADVLKAAGVASLSEGTAQAAGTLAEYYIKRAEQYQPVVSLYGGSKVEIVFLEGVDFAEVK